MRQVLTIALGEFRALFCSPISWLLLVVFTWQAGAGFFDGYGMVVRFCTLGNGLPLATEHVFSSGLFATVQKSLHLYVPLLTMGVFCREFNSGTFRLLYSSPVASWQIVVGKYMALVAYALLLTAIMAAFVVLGWLTIDNLSLPLIGSGVLALLLLYCSYTAIGMFLSSLTRYQVAAAIATFAVFGLLYYIGQVGQDLPMVSDIAYWASMNGRTEWMLKGLVCSSDVIYYVLVIVLFILLTIWVIDRGKDVISRRQMALRITVGLGLMAMGAALSSLPRLKLYADVTETQRMTLCKTSRDVCSRLDGEELTVTTYVNIGDEGASCRYALPIHQNDDRKRFEPYRRWLPDMRFNYVYYYHKIIDNGENLPYDEALKKAAQAHHISSDKIISLDDIDCASQLKACGYVLTRKMESSTGRKVWLHIYDDVKQMPSEREITAALAKLAGTGDTVVMVGDRCDDFARTITAPHNRMSLCNQGLVVNDEAHITNFDGIDALLMLDCQDLSGHRLDLTTKAIEQGRNALIALNPQNADAHRRLFDMLGITFDERPLLNDNPDFDPRLALCGIVPAAASVITDLAPLAGHIVTMPSAGSLTCRSNSFSAVPLLSTAKGETTAMLLKRNVGNAEQRIIVAADADFLSDNELKTRRNNLTAVNTPFAEACLSWLDGNRHPLAINYAEPSDRRVNCMYEQLPTLRWLYLGLLPALIVFMGSIVIVRRNKK